MRGRGINYRCYKYSSLPQQGGIFFIFFYLVNVVKNFFNKNILYGEKKIPIFSAKAIGKWQNIC
jgi:hypothetical protein